MAALSEVRELLRASGGHSGKQIKRLSASCSLNKGELYACVARDSKRAWLLLRMGSYSSFGSQTESTMWQGPVRWVISTLLCETS